MTWIRRPLLLVAVLALVAAACGGGASTEQPTTEAPAATTAPAPSLPDLGGREVTVAVENAYVPFNFIPEGSDEATGFDYDVWAEICKRLNCTPVFVEAGWPDVIQETGEGQYDVAADGISITEERKQVVAYSDPYMVVEQKIMVRLDEDRFSTVKEFIDGDYQLGTQTGTTNYELGAELVGEDRIEAFDQFGLAVEALISGDVDGVIIDDVAGQGYQGVNADKVKLLPEGLQSDPLGFIYPKGSDLIDPVNQALAEMKADGTLDAIIKKWFIDFEGA